MRSRARRRPKASRAEGRERAAATRGTIIGAYKKDLRFRPLALKWRITERIRLIEAMRT